MTFRIKNIDLIDKIRKHYGFTYYIEAIKIALKNHLKQKREIAILKTENKLLKDRLTNSIKI